MNGLMFSSTRRFCLVPFVLCSTLFVGCGGEPQLTVYPVKGTLTLDGAPFGPCAISFLSTAEEGGKGGAGEVDASGNIVAVTTYEKGDGCPAGSFKVIVLPSMMAPTDKPIPGVYGNPAKTTLTATISDTGENTLKLELSSKGGGMMGAGGSSNKHLPKGVKPGAYTMPTGGAPK